jgi:hypothetical protein
LADVAVGAPGSQQVMVYYGKAGGLMSSPAVLSSTMIGFGAQVASAGDLNGDGYGDLAVGSPDSTRVDIFLGAPLGVVNTPARSINPTTATFGAALSAAGDVNGDGYGDLVIGAPNVNKAFVYYFTPSGSSVSHTSDTLSPGLAGFGSAVAGVGDLNGDGSSDVVIGAPTAGKLSAYLGTNKGISASAAVIVTGTAGFAAVVAGAGDVDGDGFADVVAGGMGLGASVYRGGTTLFASTQALATPVGASGFGFAVSGGGDADGDGLSDLVVGGYLSQTAYVYSGQAAGTVTARATITGATSNFGGVLSMDDLDGDGKADILVGATNLVSLFSGANLSSLGTLSPPAGAIGFASALY